MQISDNYGNHILYSLELPIKFARQDRLPLQFRLPHCNSKFDNVKIDVFSPLYCRLKLVRSMALIVRKYGGSSVTRSDQIISIADQAKKTLERGDKLVLVVSARQGRTDHLIEMAKMVSNEPSKSAMDRLISIGEDVSCAWLAIALEALGIPCETMSGKQAGIITDANFGNANIIEIHSQEISRVLSENKIPIVAGFQGVTKEGELTTLGRGGSDVTAVAIASALSADICEICGDVDGVYTADPKAVQGASRLEQIDYKTMLEWSLSGARVFDHKAVKYAQKHQVPVRVMHADRRNKGTLISPKVAFIKIKNQESASN